MNAPKDWTKVLVPPTVSILEVLEIIDKGGLRIALVVDHEHRMLGTVTDGDVRRGILRGVSLERPVGEVMNPAPTVACIEDGREDVLRLMADRGLHHIPVVDGSGRLVDVHVLEELLHPPEVDTWVVLMVGGLGIRLRPLTEQSPKPMLHVGGKPVLETVLCGFVAQGFRRFYFCVNYKAEVIEGHFGDGSPWGAEIRYVREAEPLGTAGALSLLPERPPSAFVVMNGDVLTTVDFRQLLRFHREHHAAATMCVRVFDIQVPYGVVKVENQRLVGFEEKPVQSFFVNAGIYVLEPAVLDHMPIGRAFDMPALFERLQAAGSPAALFPVREYWMDMGGQEDYVRANHEYPDVFR